MSPPAARSKRPRTTPARCASATTVLQAGTTAIDRAGNVRGAGDVVKQVDAIMAIAEWSMARRVAGSTTSCAVASTSPTWRWPTRRRAPSRTAFAMRGRQSTLVEVRGLARPEQLIEIELDAVDGASQSAKRFSSGRSIEDQYAYSRAVRVGDRVFISGSTALNARGTVDGPGDLYRQTRSTLDTIFAALDQAGGTPADLVYTKSFFSDLAHMPDYTRAWLEAFGDVRPTSTTLGIPALLRPEMLIEIEAEAIIGASKTRRNVYTQREREKPRGYARLVEVGDRIYMSGCTDLDAAGELQAPGDWAAQYDHALETARWSLEQVGATLDDVVRRQTFTVDGAQVNRPTGRARRTSQAAAPRRWAAASWDSRRPELLVEVEVLAVKGAGQNIQSLGPDGPDPLD
jgi:enamine deaminase RidA (YjgF/YER057c/UK114 family)